MVRALNSLPGIDTDKVADSVMYTSFVGPEKVVVIGCNHLRHELTA